MILPLIELKSGVRHMLVSNTNNGIHITWSHSITSIFQKKHY